MKTIENCWICGNLADSGEHIIKSSDIRHLFALKANNQPIYIRNSETKNQKVFGVNSQKLKWKSRICSSCNNKLTQPYDLAWQKLSTYFSKVQKGVNSINLRFIYGKEYKKEIVNLQLYLVKLLGFAFVNSDIKKDILGLNKFLLEGKAHPEIKILITHFRNWPLTKFLRISDLSVIRDFHGIVFAMMSYSIGAWQVSVVYNLSRSPKVEAILKSFSPTKPPKLYFPQVFEDDMEFRAKFERKK